ncbi:hypothetical protein M407DRAFT_29912 [Tulasnella calospora MUT 4182]|uniref:Zn(2)-C6 fungal-type domain-containing protein n=1 Tax=Tulasnella calospora MUT 4182 TaxID=1051891 RepID=A0A0C3LG78_9AGAM|nr:hypothetical protein M407DRAFT_29912 [Tulasnella calospora MUT 4182]
MSGPGSNHFPFPYMPQAPSNIDPSVAAALYHQQQAHQQAGLSGTQTGLFPPPPPPASQPTPLSDSSLDSPDPSRGGSVANASGKRPARDSDAARKKTKLEHDGEYNEYGDIDAAGTSQKIKQTRGSRACTVCRRLKMKCVGAENGPPCKRCETGGHEEVRSPPAIVEQDGEDTRHRSPVIGEPSFTSCDGRWFSLAITRS